MSYSLPAYKTIKLQDDDLLMGFKKNDEIIIQIGKDPTPGSLVVINYLDKLLISRYEQIDGKKYLWPPRGITTCQYDEVILGEAVELNRSLMTSA